MRDLKDLRLELDQIDAQIVELYLKRMDLTRQVGEYKLANGIKVLDQSRENEKLAKVTEGIEDSFHKEAVEKLFIEIMATSRKQQHQLMEEAGASEGEKNLKACFRSGDMFLPETEELLEKWPVIACDQFTSQQEYWNELESEIGDAPSTLNIIFPEIYLSEGFGRIPKIQAKMDEYLKEKVLKERVKDGFVLVERITDSGIRLGLVGVVDLDSYDYHPGNQFLTRATEGTIESRIPPRKKIRSGASLESSHIMLLIDDPREQLIEELYRKRALFPVLYDQELLMDGGHIRGYLIDGEMAGKVNNKLYEMQCESGGFFIAVGDGNHSLATAKACWDEKKETLSEEERENHPAKYALTELVNLHSQALIFEAIHRVVFHIDGEALMDAFKTYLEDEKVAFSVTEYPLLRVTDIPKQKAEDLEKIHQVLFLYKDSCYLFEMNISSGRLPVDYVQTFLASYVDESVSAVDYIHGEENVRLITAEAEDNLGIILPVMKKEELFPAIKAGGVLPRKTFSMGEAVEKRYYMECRKISE